MSTSHTGRTCMPIGVPCVFPVVLVLFVIYCVATYKQVSGVETCALIQKVSCVNWNCMYRAGEDIHFIEWQGGYTYKCICYCNSDEYTYYYYLLLIRFTFISYRSLLTPLVHARNLPKRRYKTRIPEGGRTYSEGKGFAWCSSTKHFEIIEDFILKSVLQPTLWTSTIHARTLCWPRSSQLNAFPGW